MGADCRARGRALYIGGGAALAVAALAARGTTLLQDPGHIRRGYADLPGELASLGGLVLAEGNRPVHAAARI